MASERWAARSVDDTVLRETPIARGDLSFGQSFLVPKAQCRPLAGSEGADQVAESARLRLLLRGPGGGRSEVGFLTPSAEGSAGSVDRHRVHPARRRFEAGDPLPPLDGPSERFVDRVVGDVGIAHGAGHRLHEVGAGCPVPGFDLHGHHPFKSRDPPKCRLATDCPVSAVR